MTEPNGLLRPLYDETSITAVTNSTQLPTFTFTTPN